jgi:hypothetical protein
MKKPPLYTSIWDHTSHLAECQTKMIWYVAPKKEDICLYFESLIRITLLNFWELGFSG